MQQIGIAVAWRSVVLVIYFGWPITRNVSDLIGRYVAKRLLRLGKLLGTVDDRVKPKYMNLN